MSKCLYLKRRSSGVYVVRLVVPAWLRAAAGQREVHRSTGCRDLALAKIVAGSITAEWHRRLVQFRRMDPDKLRHGVVDLLGDGLLPLVEAANSLGAAPLDLARRLERRRASFFVRAREWGCWLVADLRDLVDERDALGEITSIDISDAALQAHGERHRHSGEVRVAFSDQIMSMLETGESACIGIFRLPRDPSAGLVIDPGVSVGVADLLVQRRDVEVLRVELAAAMPVLLPAATPAGSAPSGIEALAAVQDSIAKHRHYSTPVSDLVSRYLEHLRGKVGDDEIQKQGAACSALMELTDDMQLGRIDRDVITSVARELRRVPDRRDLVRRSHPHLKAWRDLIEFAERENLNRLTPGAVERIVEDMQSVFDFGCRQGWLRENPARGLAAEVFDQMGGVRTQHHQRRDRFSDDDLQRIFSAEWFAKGVGRSSAKGVFHSYRPHYYWLPLLGLYTGGRINELSQLHLSDVRQAASGAWYLDFNLEQEDKVEGDDSDDTEAGAGAEVASDGRVRDKSLKTVNSHRVVPLHSKLVELGLIDYLAAVRSAGYQRVFPELAFDKRKGYGKPASSWFNERFLGTALKIERNGRKVFHSFRHNFATALERAEAPARAIRQLMGHSLVGDRGEETAPGYKKARELDELVPAIQLLSPKLPPIAAFRIDDGLRAVRDAIQLKKAQRPACG